ncbi:MAG: YHS domain-containing protein [Pseudomonadales bacterium]|nr:YHS domain-containing protein [Pseudomonadales bacterium]
MRKLMLSLTAVVSLLTASIASAAIDAIYTGLFSNEALRGYDTVAYFTEGMPVEGSNAYSTEYMGAVWKFSSQQHLDLFLADPEKYAPQYGGYCAYAMANGDTASAEPDLWTIHEGKLYLNYSRRINRRWKEDMNGYIEQADIEWPKFEKE